MLGDSNIGFGEGSSPESRLEIVADRHDAGSLTDDECAAQKAKILSGS